MQGQTRLLNELQVLCEFTQNDIIKANRELQKKDHQKNQLTLQYEECDQMMVTLKNRHGQLESQYENKLQGFKQQLSASKGRGDREESPEDQSAEMSHWGKRISPSKKTKSHVSMYNAVSDIEAMNRMINK